jgi:hypothetical protein
MNMQMYAIALSDFKLTASRNKVRVQELLDAAKAGVFTEPAYTVASAYTSTNSKIGIIKRLHLPTKQDLIRREVEEAQIQSCSLPQPISADLVKLIRDLEKSVKHLGTECTNYSIVKLLVKDGKYKCGWTEEQFKEIMQPKADGSCLNKTPWQIAGEIHNRHIRIQDYTGRCAKRPVYLPNMIGSKVLIGKDEYYLCHCTGANSEYVTFYHAADIKRWKLLSKEEINEDKLIHYLELDPKAKPS